MQFEEQIKLEESFSQSAIMDVTELRLLYQGRIGIYVHFTDEGRYDDSVDSGDKNRPRGLLCYTVADVIGKKVKDPSFYGNIFRVQKNSNNKKFIEDIRQYDSSDLKRDIEKIYEIGFIDNEVIDEIVNKVSNSTKFRNMFQRFWKITEMISATKGRYASAYWRRILYDIGYLGFSDPSGTGTFTKKRNPVTLWLYQKYIDELDIIPIQKKRNDPRSRVASWVNREVTKLQTKRNQVSKRRFKNREDSKNFLQKLLNI